MQCPNCQQDNPAHNMFCSRCASALGKQQIRLQNKSKVFMPPQTTAETRAKSRGSNPVLPTLVFLLVVIGLVGLLWMWLYY